MSYVLIGQRCLLATVFLLACFGKVRDAAHLRRFATSIEKLTKLPAGPARAVAWATVAGEGAVPVLLAFAPTARAGFVVATGLLAAFVAVVVRAVRGGVLAECRCFGRAGAVMSVATIIRNLLLIAVAVPGVVMSPTTPATRLGGVALALAVGFAVAVFFARYYDEVTRAVVRRRSSAKTPGPAPGAA